MAVQPFVNLHTRSKKSIVRNNRLYRSVDACSKFHSTHGSSMIDHSKESKEALW